MVCKVIHSTIKPMGKPQIEDCSPSRKSPFSRLERQDSAPEGKCCPSLKSICLIRQHRVCPYLKNCLRTSNCPLLCHLHIYIMYAREGEGLEVSLQRLFLQGLFLRRRAPAWLLNMSSERRRELLRQHHKWFCERQKNCFWHSSRLKKKGEKRLAAVFISLFRGYAAILAPHRKTCGVWRGRTVGGSGGLHVL